MDAELQPVTTVGLYMDVNFLGAVKVTRAFLPLLRRSRGRIVNVSSLAGPRSRSAAAPAFESQVDVLSPAGEVPVPLFSAYGATKAALAVYSKVLRLELSAWGVRVSLIQPSGFRTSTSGGCSHRSVSEPQPGRCRSDGGLGHRVHGEGSGTPLPKGGGGLC